MLWRLLARLCCNSSSRPRVEARLPHLWVHTFDTIEDLRRGLQEFVAHYNATWLVARHGYRTPNQIRAEQRRLAQCRPANLPLAA
jgi:putative transposase